jgi:GH25 family lysozyme M1 (1,4-beta-N-acetylmuramidase)
MKATLATALLSLGLVNAVPTSQPVRRDTLQGVDISHYQESFDYTGAYADGIVFAMIKATESTTYTDPSVRLSLLQPYKFFLHITDSSQFSTHYSGTYDAGMIRGAYHFAQPGDSSGADQANFFLDNGGAWSADGQTLPGMLDLEADCSGISSSDMVAWIQDFVDTYHAGSGRYPILYFSPSWVSSPFSPPVYKNLQC